ncbi:hypothetical protein Q673_11075 [Marinobacter sp. EN3]|uniref:DUF262 domain-containing protein n=1 Tax=Marinobacter sp. EN3 TaxID=1397533 RepID=UPI0003B83FBF|nr:DUF262 domain-containing protein [Marinobacter sp. EN3]ERS11503.1 hypothetical protein Q673_11075 [Marinobacter sp. EN3]
MAYDSQIISLAEIVEKEETWTFNVPIYQRLYVWGSDQVKTLLDDLVNAYERDEDLFFLGGTLVVEQPSNHGRKFELIDGQQRFTTLWMLCHVWRGALEPFLTVKEGRQILPRLGFAIRPTVNRYLRSLVFIGHDEESEAARETSKMREAVATMEALFKRRSLPDGVSLDEHLAGLSRYVFEKVKLVFTVVPTETDLNKLFEVINNRGVQLQHHEILKARMLDALSDQERQAYAILWDSCADMGEFVERGLAANSPLSAKDVAQLCDAGAMVRDAEPLAKAVAVLKRLDATVQDQGSADALGLDEILISHEECGELDNTDEGERQEGTTWMRSIVGFPMFLQHALRIWLVREGRPDLPRILDRELLQLFETHFFYDGTDIEQAERCRSFIKLLWELRYLFDKHFIKWVDRGDEEIHMISPLSLSKSDGALSLSRGRESEKQQGFGLLQSMLYHSQEITTHYWITPLLNFIHADPQEAENYYEYLRHLDIHLLGSTIEGSLIERTRTFLDNPWSRYALNHQEELRKEHGVEFRHYWFYKLEFVLWYLYRNENAGWRDFRFTAKNSVEHISPQNPLKQDDNRVEKMLHRFGNLALVSRGLNSEYSNLPFNEKRQRFINNNKSTVDSLKMSVIYRHETWGDTFAQKHENAMISAFDKYAASLKSGGNAGCP